MAVTDRGTSSRRRSNTTSSESGASSGSKRRHLEQGHHHSTSLLPHRGNDIHSNDDEEYSLLGSVPEEVVTPTAGAAVITSIGTTGGSLATTGKEKLLGHVDNRCKVKK
jgi:hypothetical protein